MNDQAQSKPEQPAGERTLFWHSSGRWCKKIRGKLHCFGRGRYDDALASYNEQSEDLRAGRMPAEDVKWLTVYRLTAKFLTAKIDQRDNGEL